MFLSGGIYIFMELFNKDNRTVESNDGLAVILTGILIFGLAWLVKRGHGWLKYLFLVCIVWSLFLAKPVSEEAEPALVEMIFTVVANVLQIWAVVLLFLVPRKAKVVVE